MADPVSVICLPDGLEIVVQGKEGELQAYQFRWHQVGSTKNGPFRDTSEALRAKRFGTVEEVIAALRIDVTR